ICPAPSRSGSPFGTGGRQAPTERPRIKTNNASHFIESSLDHALAPSLSGLRGKLTAGARVGNGEGANDRSASSTASSLARTAAPKITWTRAGESGQNVAL